MNGYVAALFGSQIVMWIWMWGLASRVDKLDRERRP